MGNKRRYLWFVVIVVLVLALASCGGGATQPAKTGETPAAGTSGGGATGTQVVVTPDMAGKTIEMTVGQQLLAKLGTEGNCKVDVTPTFLLNPVEGATLNEGEQGLWEAKMNGSATLQATCDNSKQYNVSIKINPAQ